jgi:hypothetical protein
MYTNQKLIFKEYTDRWPVEGTHLATKTLNFDPDAPAPQGGITVRIFGSR